MYRPGDVLLVPIDELPEGLERLASEAGLVILARGEASGHAHTIKDVRAALFRDPKLATVFMRISGNAPVLLEHFEHDAIAIPAGNYRVVRQREYAPNEIRRVAD
jgi:hypothetical protein